MSAFSLRVLQGCLLTIGIALIGVFAFYLAAQFATRTDRLEIRSIGKEGYFNAFGAVYRGVIAYQQEHGKLPDSLNGVPIRASMFWSQPSDVSSDARDQFLRSFLYIQKRTVDVEGTRQSFLLTIAIPRRDYRKRQFFIAAGSDLGFDYMELEDIKPLVSDAQLDFLLKNTFEPGG